jgi:hypothetical protein
MAVLMVPDTTVLINFAILRRMDLLGRLADGDGRWCATVATECAESARVTGLTALDGAGAIFGEPLFPDEAEHQDALVLRDGLVRPGDPPTKHLGEAETLAIIERRQLRGFFVTDDHDASRLAAREGVQVVATWDLLRVAHRQGWLGADALWGYVRTLERHDRGAPRRVRDRPSFDKWAAA